MKSDQDTGRDADELYIAAGPEVHPAGSGCSWVHNRLSGSILFLDDYLSALLPHLSEWRTLKEHIASLEEIGISSLNPSSILSQLRHLADLGLLVSKANFIGLLMRRPDVQRKTHIASVTWSTRDRPTELARSVASFSDCLSRPGDVPIFIVFDDSTSESMRRQNREAIRPISPQIRYMGESEKQKLAHEILALGDGIDPDVIGFALFGMAEAGITTGANHNAQLLSTIGDATLSADDDTICEFTGSATVPDTVELSSAADPSDFLFFENKQALDAAVEFRKIDIIDTLKGVLGRSVGECVMQASIRGQPHMPLLERCSAQFVQSLVTFGGTIAVAAVGTCGDSGLVGPRHVLTLQGSSRERLLSSESLYQAAVANRLLVRAVPRTTIGSSAYCQAMCLGLDNSLPLPPFFPVGRSSDAVFGQTLRSCFPDLYIAYLPWAIHHEPPDKRSLAPETVTDLPIRIPELMNLLLFAFEKGAWAAPGLDRLEEAGRFLQDVSSLADQDFLQFIRGLCLSNLSRYVEYLDGLLAIYGHEPDFWAKDVESHIERLQKLPTEPDFCIPADLREGRERSEVITLSRRLVDLFGELLESWTEIRKAAQSLRESGRELIVPV